MRTVLFLCGPASSGKHLWHINLGQEWEASPMTYEVGGRQFITIAGPTGIFTFALNSDKL